MYNNVDVLYKLHSSYVTSQLALLMWRSCQTTTSVVCTIFIRNVGPNLLHVVDCQRSKSLKRLKFIKIPQDDHSLLYEQCTHIQ